MNQNSIIVFVCEHGAAKSIIAAAYFNKLAGEKNLNVQAVARGTNPDQALSPKAIAGLQEDGLTPTKSVPRKLSLADVESAQQIITFCELPAEYQGKLPSNTGMMCRLSVRITKRRVMQSLSELVNLLNK